MDLALQLDYRNLWPFDELKNIEWNLAACLLLPYFTSTFSFVLEACDVFGRIYSLLKGEICYLLFFVFVFCFSVIAYTQSSQPIIVSLFFFLFSSGDPWWISPQRGKEVELVYGWNVLCSPSYLTTYNRSSWPIPDLFFSFFFFFFPIFLRSLPDQAPRRKDER